MITDVFPNMIKIRALVNNGKTNEHIQSIRSTIQCIIKSNSVADLGPLQYLGRALCDYSSVLNAAEVLDPAL